MTWLAVAGPAAMVVAWMLSNVLRAKRAAFDAQLRELLDRATFEDITAHYEETDQP